MIFAKEKPGFTYVVLTNPGRPGMGQLVILFIASHIQ